MLNRKHYTKDGIAGDFMGERKLRKMHTKKAIHEMNAAQFQAVKKAASKEHVDRHTTEVRSEKM
jgi:hypothetical protein